MTFAEWHSSFVQAIGHECANLRAHNMITELETLQILDIACFHSIALVEASSFQTPTVTATIAVPIFLQNIREPH